MLNLVNTETYKSIKHMMLLDGNLNDDSCDSEPSTSVKDKTVWVLIRNGDLDNLRNYIRENPLALKSKHGPNKKSMLHFAITKVQIGIIEFLLFELQISPDQVDKKKKTALHLACIKLQNHISVFRKILQCSVNAKFTPDSSLRLPIHYGCMISDFSIVEALLEGEDKEKQLSFKDKLGNTPLHYACKNTNFSLVRLLVDAGSDLAIANSHGETPLHYSIRKNDETICHILVNSGADISIRYERKLYNERHSKYIRHMLKQASINLESQNGSVLNTQNYLTKKTSTTDYENFLDYKLNQFGFIVGSESDQNQKLAETNAPDMKRENRIHKWIKIIDLMHSNTTKFLKMKTKLNSLIYKGIPNSVRPEVWRYISNSIFLRQRNQGEYQRLLTIKPSKVNIIQIDLDIMRTYRTHFLFHERFGHGQISLFNILSAYSVYDSDVGYCQGMSDVTAVFLMYFEEEEAFWLLVRFMKDRKFLLTQRFRLDLYGTKKSFYVHDMLLQKYHPKIYNVLKRNEINGDHYTIRWYLKLFLDATPFATSLRIWDVLFDEGINILYTFGIVLMGYYESIIINQPSDQILMYLISIKGPPSNVSIDKWFKDVRNNKIKSKFIRSLESKFDEIFSKNNPGFVPMQKNVQSVKN